ncbi:hypothetical protein C8T65DRAFT_666572 [Cerioporus squamosus]|nr:hypothetical protein C8T65DRAFT_666572 [Cerioporus squamosus]
MGSGGVLVMSLLFVCLGCLKASPGGLLRVSLEADSLLLGSCRRKLRGSRRHSYTKASSRTGLECRSRSEHS